MILLSLIFLLIFSNFCEPQSFLTSVNKWNSLNLESIPLFTTLNISTDCTNSLKEYLINLKSFGNWGLKMSGSSAKTPQGVLYGHTLILGNYDSCMNIRSVGKSGDIFGKYCLASENTDENQIFNYILQRYNIKQNFNELAKKDKKITLNWGLCFPSSCKAHEAELIYRYFHPNLKLNEEFCQSGNETTSLTNMEIALLCLIAIWIVMVAVSTLYEIFSFDKNITSKFSYVLSFSARKNWIKLFYDESKSDRLHCIDGIGVLTTFSVILGSEFSFFTYIPQLHTKYYKEWVSSSLSFEAISSSLCSETFLLIGGLLTTYNFMRKTDEKKKFNIFKWNFQRYMKFTLPLVALMITQRLILNHVFKGPLIPYLRNASIRNCNNYWWTTILYLQNFVNSDNLCLPHTWYLNVHFQLQLLCFLGLVGFIYDFKRSILLLFSFLIVISTCISFGITWEQNLNPAGFVTGNYDQGYTFFTEYYVKTYTRMAPWFIGMILGYFIHKSLHKGYKVRLNKLIVALIWIIAISIMYLCIYLIHDILANDYNNYKKLNHSFLIAFICPMWSISLCWIIFACSYGYGGILNTFLSQPIFGYIRRISYCMYLLHFPFISLIIFRQRQQVLFDNYLINYLFVGDLFYIMILAIIWTIFFVLPVDNIMTCIFGNDENNKNVNALKEKTKDSKRAFI